MENLATSKKVLLEIKDAKYILYLEDGYLAIKKNMEFVHFQANSTTGRSINVELEEKIQGDLLTAHRHPVDRSVLVAMRSGELVLFVEEDSDKGTLRGEMVGSFPAGILAAAVSPDDEVMALVTNDCQFILMSRSSLFPLMERPMTDLVGDVQQGAVNVGWGRKETQFHGSAGKQAAMTAAQIREECDATDDGEVRLSWKRDSSAVACSFVQTIPKDNRHDHGSKASAHREIILVDRKGRTLGRKEATEGLGQAMAWRSSETGGLIAASHRRPDRSLGVVFFEQNGLRHGEFYLKGLQPENIVELAWNCDGSILSMLLADGRALLWSCANHHWYLKYVLPGKAARLLWSPTAPLQVALLTTWGGIAHYELMRRFDRSNCGPQDALSLVAVVDGQTLHLTPFAISNVPPPLSLTQLQLDFVPNCVGIHFDNDEDSNGGGSTGRLAVASATGTVVIFMIGMQQGQLLTAQLNTFSARANLKQIVFQDVETIFCLPDEGLTLQCPADGIIDRKIVSYVVRQNRILYLDDSGNVFGDDTKAPILVDAPKGPWCDLYIVKDQVHFLTLTAENTLFVDDLRISSDCTSFLLHPDFLCTTTKAGLVRFFPLTMSPNQWMGLRTDGEESSRLTEGGALLVTTVPKNAALILQMPRGNLETIYPRAFVLAKVRTLLDALHYTEAFGLCRRHRLDLNIIHDNNPTLFMATISNFVFDVNKAEHLNLFMAALRPENVVAGRYASFGVDRPATPAIYAEKVNVVCDRIRECLSADGERYFESIMTAYVCRQPPDYEAACSVLAQLAQASSSSTETVEGALKYLLFLVPAEKLYRVALGMYNLPLALSIARRSQMDPAEYVEWLQSVSSISEEHMQRFTIDEFLQRYDRALGHLLKAKRPFDECNIFIKRHALYPKAFTLYQQSEETIDDWRRLCVEYAEHLLGEQANSSSTEAVDLLVFAGQGPRALQLATRLGLWQKALTLATNRQQTAGELLRVLVEKKEMAAALLVAELYLDPTIALDVAMKTEQWSDASRIAQAHKLDFDIVSVETQGETMLAHLDELMTTFREKASRLELLQTQLVESLDPRKIIDVLENNTLMANVDDGTMSEMSFKSAISFAGSTATALSRATSSKSRKKADKQRLRGKPGSPFERDYLRETLKETLTTLLLLRQTSVSLIQVLAEHYRFDLARRLQSRLRCSLEEISQWSGRLKRLLEIQEEKMGPEVLSALGLNIFNIPSTLQIGHEWKTAFDLPSDILTRGFLHYLDQ